MTDKTWTRARRLGLGASALTLGLAVMAHAQTEVTFELTPYHWSLARGTSTTGVSGVAGTALPVRDPSGLRVGVVGVGFVHPATTGDTVQIGLESRLQGNDSVSQLTPLLPTCAMAGTCVGATGSAARWVRPATADEVFVTGVAVCTDGNASATNVTVRGVRLEYGRVAPNGSITTVTPTEEVSVGGCSTWHAMQRCPAGAIAVNVLGQLHGTLPDARRYRGIALQCAAVQPPPVHPARTHEFSIDTSANVTVETVVGSAGARQRLLGGDGVFQGLFELHAPSQSRRLCGGGLVMRELSDSGRTEAGATLEIMPNFPACSQTPGQPAVELWERFSEVGHDQYIIGVRKVRESNSGDEWIYGRLGPRGGRLALERVRTENNSFVELSAPGVEEVTCPDEHVVTGLLMHTRDNSYTGFQLVCSPVRAPAVVPVAPRPGR